LYKLLIKHKDMCYAPMRDSRKECGSDSPY